jgi:uncharacterized protein YjbI with pentapeptide repeats
VIVTFYSYKGGVGRSMALVNVGEMLADIGYDVVVCDFDLEAPGLERYIADNAEAASAFRANRGVIDLLEEYKDTLATPDEPASGEAAEHAPLAGASSGRDAAPRAATAAEYREVNGVLLRRPSNCAVQVKSPNRLRLGRLRYLSAGRRDGKWEERYNERVQRFDWSDFYARWAGAAYIDFFRDDLTEGQTIVLLDSRTGVTEQGGVCTHHLADLVLLLSAPNDINMEGTRWMADLLAKADLTELRRDRPLQVLPVAARVETASQVEELGVFREQFETTFAARVPAAVGDGTRFVQAAEIPYIPYFAFKEKVVARQGSGPRHRELHRAYETLAAAIVDIGLDMELLRPPRRRNWLDERRLDRAADSLEAVLERHRRWLSSRHTEGDRAVLRARDLSRIELTGADLREADLTEANLEQADLREVDLSGAKLTGARLQGAKLDRATLSSADLASADLTSVDLSRAVLDFCDLTLARLEGARLREARMRGSILRGARLTRADLAGCDLRDSDLTDAFLLATDLRGADLTGANGINPDDLQHAITDDTTRIGGMSGTAWIRRASSSTAPDQDVSPARESEIVPVSHQREYPAFATDFRVLDETLMPAFRDADHDAVRIGRRHRIQQAALIAGVAAIAVLGGATAVLGQTISYLQGSAAVGAVVIPIVARMLSDLERRSLASRYRAQSLRSEYFRYLGRVGPYADAKDRSRMLRVRVARIVGEGEGR